MIKRALILLGPLKITTVVQAQALNNIALGKAVSALKPTVADAISSVTDGNPDTGYVQATPYEEHDWLEIDFGAS